MIIFFPLTIIWDVIMWYLAIPLRQIDLGEFKKHKAEKGL